MKNINDWQTYKIWETRNLWAIFETQKLVGMNSIKKMMVLLHFFK
jgi:hypothetical protein